MFRSLTRQGSLLNPFFQALPFAIIAIFFIPDIFNKYEAVIIQSNNSTEKFIQKYIEIDGDNYNEKVILHYDVESIPTASHISVYSSNDAPRFNIKFKHPWIDFSNLFYADINKNGKNEIFVFTRSEDTIYLNQFEYHSNDSIRTKMIQVEIIKNLNSTDEILLNHIGNSDINGDGTEEFIFLMIPGTSQESEGIFAWDIKNNNITRSPKFGISLNTRQYYMCDVDEDGYKEILLSTHPNNSCGTSRNLNRGLPYLDSISYILVLDHDLTFLFNPIPVSCQYSYTLPLRTAGGVKIASFAGFENDGKVAHQINLYNIDGALYKSKNIDSEIGHCKDWIFTKNNGIDNEFFMVHTEGIVEQYNSDLELIDYWDIEPIEAYPIRPIDFDNDGKNEFVFKKVSNSIYSNNFLITQNDLSYPVSVIIEGKLIGASITHKDKINNKGVFLLQLSNEDNYLCRFQKNPNHKYEYFIWGLIYVILVIFIAIVQWAQRLKTKNKIKKEKELAEFQLMAIKNQIDPHFTLNTLNAISSLYGKGENKEAYKYMTKLSRLMLLVLNESDQISSTLKAEVDMIKNYIELQLIRFNDSFSYVINWDEKKLGEREVPRMLIHTFTENAIKHGLRPKEKGGHLSISIREKSKHLYIIIEDNGVGRKTAALDKSLSSGKGVGISNSICQLYHQIRNVKVSYRIDDLFKIDKSTNEEIAAGTKVSITVHPKLFKI